MGATGPHFSEAELACHHCGVNGCKQSLVDALEAFRAIVGKPVIVSSAYRCPQHNAEAGGAGRSEHVEGLAADIRVAADNTRFAQIEVKRGIYPIGGATVRMYQEIGWGNAMRILLTGDEFSAQDALRVGLVQEVVPTGSQLARALEIADTISRQSPVGVQATLASARLARAEGERAAIARFLPDMQQAIASDDAVEGLAAFLERREPRF